MASVLGQASRRRVRVLIVDDSAFVRRTLRTLLLSSRDVEVVGAATDGDDGLRLVDELAPDVITLDLEMPRLDGFAFLRILMRRRPIPVIVVSSHSDRQTVLRALELGALDFVAKPERTASPNLVQIRGELVDKVLAAAGSRVGELRRRLEADREAADGRDVASGREAADGREVASGREGADGRDVASGREAADGRDGSAYRVGQADSVGKAHPRGSQGGAAVSALAARPSHPAASVLVVGTSTGGPSSLRRLLGRLPVDLPFGVVVAQHMPAKFTRAFAERLDRELLWVVREAEPGMRICTGEVYIAPGGHHTEVVSRASRLVLEVLPAGIGDRYVPSVDRLFSSAADAAGPLVLCLVLTGMGSDGAMGVQYVKVHGGKVLAESEESAVVFGMPRAAIDSGAVDHVLPLDALGPRLAQLATTS